MNRFDKYVIDFAAKMNEGWDKLPLNEKISRAAQLLVRCLKRFEGSPNERTTGLPTPLSGNPAASLLYMVRAMYHSAAVYTGV